MRIGHVLTGALTVIFIIFATLIVLYVKSSPITRASYAFALFGAVWLTAGFVLPELSKKDSFPFKSLAAGDALKHFCTGGRQYFITQTAVSAIFLLYLNNGAAVSVLAYAVLQTALLIVFVVWFYALYANNNPEKKRRADLKAKTHKLKLLKANVNYLLMRFPEAADALNAVSDAADALVLHVYPTLVMYEDKIFNSLNELSAAAPGQEDLIQNRCGEILKNIQSYNNYAHFLKNKGVLK